MPWGAAAAAVVGAYSASRNRNQSTTSTSEQNPWAEQSPYLQDLFAQAQNWYNDGGMQAYGGQLVAGMDPAATQGQNMAIDAAQGIGSELIGGANNAWLFALNDAMDPNSNPYLQAAADAAGNNVTRQFQDNILPQLRLSQIGGNNFNSSRSALAEGQATGEVGRALADINTNMYNSAYNSGLQARMQALGMSGDMYNLNQMPANTMMQIGGQRQAYEQAVLDAQRAQFMQNQTLPLQNLQAYQQLIGGNYGGQGSTTQQVPGISPLQAALGYGSMGMGLINQYNQYNPANQNNTAAQLNPTTSNTGMGG